MSAIKPIIIKDGATTPVDHTFSPQNAQKGSEPAVWYERVGGTPLGYNRITARVDAKPTGVSKVKLVIATPKVAQVPSGCCIDMNTPQVSYTEFANIEFSLPATSTLLERKDILAYAKNLLSNADIVSMVENLEPAY